MSATLYEIAEQALSRQPEEYAEWMERCSDPLSVRRMDYERWTPTQREIVRKHLQEACLESESIDLVVSMLHGFDRRMCVVSICGLFSRLLPSLKGQGEKESREALAMYRNHADQGVIDILNAIAELVRYHESTDDVKALSRMAKRASEPMERERRRNSIPVGYSVTGALDPGPRYSTFSFAASGSATTGIQEVKCYVDPAMFAEKRAVEALSDAISSFIDRMSDRQGKPTTRGAEEDPKPWSVMDALKRMDEGES